jgi:hypothetical protein
MNRVTAALAEGNPGAWWAVSLGALDAAVIVCLLWHDLHQTGPAPPDTDPTPRLVEDERAEDTAETLPRWPTAADLEADVQGPMPSLVRPYVRFDWETQPIPICIPEQQLPRRRGASLTAERTR